MMEGLIKKVSIDDVAVLTKMYPFVPYEDSPDVTRIEIRLIVKKKVRGRSNTRKSIVKMKKKSARVNYRKGERIYGMLTAMLREAAR